MEKQIYKFTNEINEICVSSIGSKIVVAPHNEDFVLAEYDNPGETPKFCAVLQDKKLTLKEEASFFGWFSKITDEYCITVYLPKKLFEKIGVCSSSGGVSVSEVQAGVFDLSTASGEVNVSGAFEDIKIKAASGNVKLENTAEAPARSVKISTASGSVEVNAPAEKFSLVCVSGKTVYKNACGEGKISLTSGNVDVDYSEWNGALSLNVVSGKANITVPDDSGAELTFNGASGSFKTDIGGEKGSLMNIGKGTSGTLGSGNIQKLDVHLTSGSVTVQRA